MIDKSRIKEFVKHIMPFHNETECFVLINVNQYNSL